MKKWLSLLLVLTLCLSLSVSAYAADVPGAYTFHFRGQMGEETFTMTLNEDGTCHLELNPMLGPWEGTYSVEGSHISVLKLEDPKGKMGKTPALWPEYFDTQTGACELDLNDDGSFSFVERESTPEGFLGLGGGMPMMGGVQIEPKEGFLTWENEPYGDLGAQTFNAMVADDDAVHPVMIVVPGGAFRFVDGGHFSAICDTLCENGWLVVQLSYTVGAGTYPQAIIDVKTAIQYVADHAEELHADAGHLCVMGSSAGGYLASVAVFSDADAFKATDVDADYSYTVYGLVDFFGATQWMTDALCADIGADAAESEWLGADVSAMSKAERDAIDPLTELDVQDVSMVWVSHGTADTTMPILNSEQFYDGAKAVLGEENAHFEVIDGAVHEDDTFYTAENLGLVSTFMK